MSERLPCRLLPLSLIALLGACATPPPAVTRSAEPEPMLVRGASDSTDGDAAAQRGDWPLAVVAYQQAAANAAPQSASELRLRAADAANRAGDPRRADVILDQIPAAPLDARQQVRYRLLRAQTALARNDAPRALRLLPQGDPGGDPALAAEQLLLRGRAAFRTGDVVNGTSAFVNRERYLQGRAALGDNRDAIWAGLTGAPLDSTTLARANGADAITRGWIELALLSRYNGSLADYESWRQRFAGHPGEERLSTLMMPGTAVAGAPVGTLPRPATVPAPMAGAPGAVTTAMPMPMPMSGAGGAAALLLPRTGALAGIAESVRSGYAAAAARAGAVEPRVYDTATQSPVDAARAAATEGGGTVVGPLRKEEVAQLAAAPPAVPVLALNYLDAGHPPPPGFFQFGLAPEDEARAAAEDAASRGLHSAIALVPNTEWGARVLGAFEQRFTELGGRVVESGRFYGRQEYWSDQVRKLLRYSAGGNDRQKTDAAPQRRSDFDLIFIGAKPGEATMIWPLFRFYHAERTPIYATAVVSDGGGSGDTAGIRYCDAPLLLDEGWAALRADALAGRNRDGARLYALGADAFALSQRLATGNLRVNDEIPGATGTLHVDANGVVHRSLICAQTTAGAPVLLGRGAATP